MRCSAALSPQGEIHPSLLSPGTNLPQDLSQHAQPELGVAGLQARRRTRRRTLSSVEASGAWIHIAAGAKGSSNTSLIRSTSPAVARFSFSGSDAALESRLSSYRQTATACPKIHRDVFFARRNAHEPMAMAEVFRRQAKFFRAEQRAPRGRKQDVCGSRALRYSSRLSGCCSSRCRTAVVPTTSVQSAIASARLLYSSAFASNSDGANGGACFAKSDVVGIHHAQVEKAEVAHGAGGRADVERVSRGNQHHTKLVGSGCIRSV